VPRVGDVVPGFKGSSSTNWVLTWQGSNAFLFPPIAPHNTCMCADEFEGSALNESNWTPANNFTLNSQELEMYQSSNVWVYNGSLVLQTIYEPTYYGSKL
jgi:hypothetical protein